ncbi:hypothetical protein QFC19_002823 [Naganishia cerealis]|uniref:Uncharacterized protein n=1 Tax=Naganishia cerealis TaxID=610337 RepID=A0ACC2W6Y1_9TREE|nr:hypothetical protein QFC19_002823 [Naganishia cerealis]
MITLRLSIPRGLAANLYLLFCFFTVTSAQSRQPNDVGQVAGIRGVNLGGWFVTEPWITPSLYSIGGSGDTPLDEWSLCAALGKKKALGSLQDHWGSFFTRGDFEDIAAAGLNAVRIPIGYWNVIDILDSEPYVAGAYPYIIRAVYWAAELDLSVLLDLHGVPGSQNGQDNSGLSNIVSFQANQANFDRAVAAIRNLTEEFSKEVYNGTVTTIELMNEPRISDANFTMSRLKAYYSTAAQTVQQYSDSAMRVLIHDAFWGPGYWDGFNPMTNTTSTSPEWLDIDLHNYFAFAPNNNLPEDVILEKVCNTSRYLRNTPSLSPVLVGEWSLETGTAPNSSTIGRASQSRARRTWFRKLFEAQLAGYSAFGWYFWTWKTECKSPGRAELRGIAQRYAFLVDDINTWSYRRGIEDGWIPPDISNSSQLVFPILSDGCIDATYNYSAPKNPQPQYGQGSRIIGKAPLLFSLLLLAALSLAICIGPSLV